MKLAILVLALVATSASACNISVTINLLGNIMPCINSFSNEVSECDSIRDRDCICPLLEDYLECTVDQFAQVDGCIPEGVSNAMRNVFSNATQELCTFRLRFEIDVSVNVPANFEAFTEVQARAFGRTILVTGGVENLENGAFAVSWSRGDENRVMFKVTYVGLVAPTTVQMQTTYNDVDYQNDEGNSDNDNVEAEDVTMSSSVSDGEDPDGGSASAAVPALALGAALMGVRYL
ncbi:uncharacterized protein MONBRDRAFT_29254 [Monosiga brevicollis MX1]|uniref:Extracellular membrane protein CFEM domain-containing protein n=1 Tax=Monosiga brevicollis TaxID=81824 RepID=A9VAK2_MONBE|nr:uncharacterized protein MONBRDRAFT_29254 [Monosiga brevicollis MX1]EDQ85336.1 predicted protein [Monosiga brevicollis MX1]|eukprot:XP_001749747.1 hypothetical protein [Monosiga brevicollis MX1]